MPRVLIIDDERPIRNTLRDILEYEKFDVDDVADGIEGIEHVKNNEYDVKYNIRPLMDSVQSARSLLFIFFFRAFFLFFNMLFLKIISYFFNRHLYSSLPVK